jgi:hypothetical protein
MEKGGGGSRGTTAKGRGPVTHVKIPVGDNKVKDVPASEIGLIESPKVDPTHNQSFEKAVAKKSEGNLFFAGVLYVKQSNQLALTFSSYAIEKYGCTVATPKCFTFSISFHCNKKIKLNTTGVTDQENIRNTPDLRLNSVVVSLDKP